MKPSVEQNDCTRRRRADDISKDVGTQFSETFRKFVHHSLPVNVSTDFTSTA
jgi:hypothetical protein